MLFLIFYGKKMFLLSIYICYMIKVFYYDINFMVIFSFVLIFKEICKIVYKFVIIFRYLYLDVCI